MEGNASKYTYKGNEILYMPDFLNPEKAEAAEIYAKIYIHYICELVKKRNNNKTIKHKELNAVDFHSLKPEDYVTAMQLAHKKYAEIKAKNLSVYKKED